MPTAPAALRVSTTVCLSMTGEQTAEPCDWRTTVAQVYIGAVILRGQYQTTIRTLSIVLTKVNATVPGTVQEVITEAIGGKAGVTGIA